MWTRDWEMSLAETMCKENKLRRVEEWWIDGMDTTWQKRLQTNLPMLRRRLKPVLDDVLAKMFADGHLVESTFETLSNRQHYENKSDRVTAFVLNLMGKSEKTFFFFITTLQELGEQELVERLAPTEVLTLLRNSQSESGSLRRGSSRNIATNTTPPPLRNPQSEYLILQDVFTESSQDVATNTTPPLTPLPNTESGILQDVPTQDVATNTTPPLPLLNTESGILEDVPTRDMATNTTSPLVPEEAPDTTPQSPDTQECLWELEERLRLESMARRDAESERDETRDHLSAELLNLEMKNSELESQVAAFAKEEFRKRKEEEEEEAFDVAAKIHPGISCDGCNEAIAGYRFKCLICLDYDLCLACDRTGLHKEHAMMRIPSPVFPSGFLNRVVALLRGKEDPDVVDDDEDSSDSDVDEEELSNLVNGAKSLLIFKEFIDKALE